MLSHKLHAVSSLPAWEINSRLKLSFGLYAEITRSCLTADVVVTLEATLLLIQRANVGDNEAGVAAVIPEWRSRQSFVNYGIPPSSTGLALGYGNTH